MDQALRADVIVGLALLALASRRLRTDVVALAALLLAVLAGVVPPDRAFAGLASPVVAIAALVMVLAAAVRGSGVLDIALRRVAVTLRWRPAQGPALGLLAALSAAGIGPAAAFTALLPAANALARRDGRERRQAAAGPLLLALLFACGLGGLVTITATVPALIVAQSRAELTGRAWGVFGLTPVGGPLAALGLLALALLFGVARLVWGGPVEARHLDDAPTPIEGYTSELLVPPGSPLAGRTVQALETETGLSARVMALIREEHRRIPPRPDWPIEACDIVVLACEPDTLQRLMEQYDLRIAGERPAARASRLAVVEAVVTATSELVGQSPRSAELDRRHRLSLMALGRSGAQPTTRLARIAFRAGDVLVLQGAADDMTERLAALGCLPLAERRIRLSRQRLAAAPVVAVLGALALVGFGVLSPIPALLGASLALLAAGVLSIEEAYAGIAWPTLITVAALIPVFGLVHAGRVGPWLVDAATAILAGQPDWIVVVRALLASLLVAGLIGAVPAALLLAPIAVAVAGGGGLGGADPLLAAVALATAALTLPWAEARDSLGRAGMGRRAALRLAVPLVIVLLVAGTTLILWWTR